jgi:hypothetical protein
MEIGPTSVCHFTLATSRTQMQAMGRRALAARIIVRLGGCVVQEGC